MPQSAPDACEALSRIGDGAQCREYDEGRRLLLNVNARRADIRRCLETGREPDQRACLIEMTQAMITYLAAGRVDAESGQIQIIKNLLSNRQDPSTERYLRVGGLIIDSTKPIGKPFPDIGKTPDDAMSRIHLEDFVSAGDLEKIAG